MESRWKKSCESISILICAIGIMKLKERRESRGYSAYVGFHSAKPQDSRWKRRKCKANKISDINVLQTDQSGPRVPHIQEPLLQKRTLFGFIFLLQDRISYGYIYIYSTGSRHQPR